MVKFAISGKANSGKNTVAQILGSSLMSYISKNPDYFLLFKKFKVFAFADPIKEMVMKMYPETNPEILWGASELRTTQVPNTNITYRQLLTDIGKLGRSYNINVWADATITMTKNYSAIEGSIPIIADLRFKLEFNMVKKDFFTIRVVRPNSLQQTAESKDISEIDLDDIPDSEFDAIIINDGTMQDLELKIRRMILEHF